MPKNGNDKNARRTDAPAGWFSAIVLLTVIIHCVLRPAFLAAFRADRRARNRFKARSVMGATAWSAKEAPPATSPLTRSKAKSGQKYAHMTPASFFTGAPPGSSGQKQEIEKPRPSPAGPRKSLYAYSAHAKPLWFTRSRWTQKWESCTP